MPASRRRLTKVKRPDLDVRFWWAVLPDCGGQPVLPLLTQLGVVFIGIGSETAASLCAAPAAALPYFAELQAATPFQPRTPLPLEGHC